MGWRAIGVDVIVSYRLRHQRLIVTETAHHLSLRENSCSGFQAGIGLLLESPTSGDHSNRRPVPQVFESNQMHIGTRNITRWVQTSLTEIKNVLLLLLSLLSLAQRTPGYKRVIRNAPAVYRLETLERLSKNNRDSVRLCTSINPNSTEWEIKWLKIK